GPRMSPSPCEVLTYISWNSGMPGSLPGGKLGSIACSAFSNDFRCAISRVIRQVSAARTPGSAVTLIRRSYTIFALASAALVERGPAAACPWLLLRPALRGRPPALVRAGPPPYSAWVRAEAWPAPRRQRSRSPPPSPPPPSGPLRAVLRLAPRDPPTYRWLR